MKILGVTICLLLVTACASTKVTNPGLNPGIHNEVLVGRTTDEALKNSKIPYSKLKTSVYIEIFSKDKGRIYSRVVPMLRTKNVKIVQNLENSEIIFRISEKMSGVNQATKSFWWLWPYPPIGYWNRSVTSQGKTELLVELIDRKTDSIIYSIESSSGTLYSDILKRRTFWLFIIPIPLEDFWASE